MTATLPLRVLHTTHFENWPNGILYKDAGDSSPWYWPWVTPLFAWELQVPAIMWKDSNGTLHRPVQSRGTTDFGSTPGFVQWIPCMNPLRFKIPCTFHDDAFQTHCFLLSKDEGVTWQLVEVTERQANDRLHDMILDNPGNPGNKLEADAYWIGVQAGGWPSWNHANNWKRRTKWAIRHRILPPDTDSSDGTP